MTLRSSISLATSTQSSSHLFFLEFHLHHQVFQLIFLLSLLLELSNLAQFLLDIGVEGVKTVQVSLLQQGVLHAISNIGNITWLLSMCLTFL
jgi:hypothetical protein